MEKYKIIIPSLLLKNNKMGKYGEEVTAIQLTDTPENLLAGGYIEAIAEAGPSAAELQKMADDAKAKEVADAQAALDAANKALSTAQANAKSAPAELKDAADKAVADAQATVNAAQAALDALTAGDKGGGKKK